MGHGPRRFKARVGLEAHKIAFPIENFQRETGSLGSILCSRASSHGLSSSALLSLASRQVLVSGTIMSQIRAPKLQETVGLQPRALRWVARWVAARCRRTLCRPLLQPWRLKASFPDASRRGICQSAHGGGRHHLLLKPGCCAHCNMCGCMYV